MGQIHGVATWIQPHNAQIRSHTAHNHLVPLRSHFMLSCVSSGQDHIIQLQVQKTGSRGASINTATATPPPSFQTHEESGRLDGIALWGGSGPWAGG